MENDTFVNSKVSDVSLSNLMINHGIPKCAKMYGDVANSLHVSFCVT